MSIQSNNHKEATRITINLQDSVNRSVTVSRTHQDALERYIWQERPDRLPGPVDNYLDTSRQTIITRIVLRGLSGRRKSNLANGGGRVAECWLTGGESDVLISRVSGAGLKGSSTQIDGLGAGVCNLNIEIRWSCGSRCGVLL